MHRSRTPGSQQGTKASSREGGERWQEALPERGASAGREADVFLALGSVLAARSLVV